MNPMDVDDEPGTPPPGIGPIQWHGVPLEGFLNGNSEGITEFTNKKKKTDKYFVTNQKLDLEAYSANYTGHTKINRLTFIADHCPPLAVEALKMALSELKGTGDTVRYHDVYQQLLRVSQSQNVHCPPMDNSWYNATSDAAKTKRNRLEQELKNYKNNLIKESIRMGHNDLGDFYYDIGDLANAMKSYSRTRDYCTTSKHIIDMCLNVIKVSIEMGNFSQIQPHFVKAEQTPEMPDRNITMGKLKCAMALADMDQGQFKKAARNLLDISFEMGSHFSDVISPNDIAVYGGLLSLASFDRMELKKNVFENSDFRQYLEAEPQIRELLQSFYNSKYQKCLDLLENMRSDLKLDIHLHEHVDRIYQNIRQKALVQYFSPFLSVDMNKMAAAFNTDVAQLEPELASLITENHIQARIDSHNKILKVKSADQRSNIFETSIKMGTEYKKQAHFAMLRIKLMRADLVVKTDDRDHRDHR
ncbi:COP9 signalosome complex subunit 1 [Rhizophlyctis rosea]|uniref:COP9 signalosome complex subunit 1 n=1 Tax=Rhizophlyctis rosea TaxID=64517 RepID=A0AAD5X5V1_9FUNG|nr:COP9 signalosome complex subunit 1 [Rhizophlyctis rosea]